MAMSAAAQMSAADATLLVVDVQDKLLPLIAPRDALVINIAFLIDGARLLGVPVAATEQYPKGLGPTTAELARRLPERPDKLTFSCCGLAAVTDQLARLARRNVVIAGIETHVCVLQTALDLLNRDHRVFVPVDAVAARGAIDHDTALRRLEMAGAVLTTSETTLFEWLGTAAHPQFKSVSMLIQQRMKIFK
jgi:nicotinamidase-related amidase